MVEGLGGHVPTAAIVRVGERPDDLSYEEECDEKDRILWHGGPVLCISGIH